MFDLQIPALFVRNRRRRRLETVHLSYVGGPPGDGRIFSHNQEFEQETQHGKT